MPATCINRTADLLTCPEFAVFTNILQLNSDYSSPWRIEITHEGTKISCSSLTNFSIRYLRTPEQLF